MKTALYTIAFIGLAQCAKLDHLKYLPPDSRPTQKESFDQGLAAPTTGQTGSFGSEPQPQAGPFGQSRSFESQPITPGPFNVGSQNAARLQGAPFIQQSSSGPFGSSAPAIQQNQGFSSGQDLNKPQATNEPSSATGTFGSNQQGQQPGGQLQKLNEPKGFFGSDKQKPVSGYTNQIQIPSTFGSVTQGFQAGPGSQETNQPQGSYDVPNSQASVSDGAQSARAYGPSQGSTIDQPGSNPTFPGTTGSSAGISHGSAFTQNSPSMNTFKSQATPGSFGASPQYSRGYDLSTANKNISPTGSYSSSLQPSQNFGGQQQDAQSSRSFGLPSKSFEAGYSTSNQAPGSFGVDKSTGLFDGSGKSIGSFDGPKKSIGLPDGAEKSTVIFNSPGKSAGLLNGPGKSTGFFNDQSTPSQSKYQPSSQNQIPIIRLDTKNYGDGTYSTAYETGNGIQAEEQGQTVGDNSRAQGSFSYTSPEGEKVGLSYTADEDGYHPQGEHLPTPPPVPEAILKSIEYNNAHPEEENDDGSYREANSPDSSGQYKTSFDKTQYPGNSNKYLVPSSGARSQFPGSSSTSLVGGSPAAGSRSFTNNQPSSNQATFSSSYPSSSASDKPQDDEAISISAPVSSNYDGQSSHPTENKPISALSGYQYKAPSSFRSTSNGPSIGSSGAIPSSSLGNFGGSKTSQGAPVNQPTQKSSFASYPGFNSPSNAPSGFKSGNSFDKDSNIPQGSSAGQVNSQDSAVVESNSPIAAHGANEGGYSSPGAGPFNTNVPQRIPSGQFPTHQSISGSSDVPSTPSGSPSNSFNPNTSQGEGSGQQRYQNFNNGPVKAPGIAQGSGNARFGPGSVSNENKQMSGQYSGFTGPQGQQNVQSSFSSGPGATKSTQFGGYQYNAPNKPFGSSGSSNLQQPGLPQPKAFPSGNTPSSDGAGNGKFGSGSGPSKIVGEFGSGEFRGQPGPTRTPGVQAQDENGGYLY